MVQLKSVVTELRRRGYDGFNSCMVQLKLKARR